jgi:hypothetical protein
MKDHRNTMAVHPASKLHAFAEAEGSGRDRCRIVVDPAGSRPTDGDPDL